MKRIFLCLIALFLMLMPMKVFADLNEGLVAYYSFNNCDAKDDSGNGHNGKIYGSPLCKNGKFGKALYFDGIDDRVELYSFNLFNKHSFTISIWINPLENATDKHADLTYFSNYNSDYNSSLNGFLTIGMTRLANGGSMADNELIGVLQAPGNHRYYFNTANSANLNKWYNLVLIYDAINESSKFYLNTQLIKENHIPLSKANFLNSSNFNIASYYYLGKFYYAKCIIDELVIYNRVLSESEIKQLYEMGIGGGTCDDKDYQTGFNEGYNKGFEEGKEFCKTHPEECGLKCEENQGSTSNPFVPPTSSNCNATFDFTTGKFHVPCFQTGDKNLWLDFQLIKYQPTVQMELKNFGTNE